MNFFLNFDIFTTNSFFFYESNKRVATCPGLLASAILYALLIYVFISSDMIQKTNPQISDQIVSLTDQNVNAILSNSNFLPSFLITDEVYNTYTYIDPTIWSFDFIFYDANGGNESLSVRLYNCSSLNFSLLYDGYLCFENSTTFDLSYDATSISSPMLEIKLSLCSNSSSNDVICKPYDEIYNFTKGKYFDFSFLQSSFDLNNYDTPVNSVNDVYGIV